MSTQYIVNEAGERVSAILPIAEYEALLRAAASEDETAFLLREPNGSILLQRIDDYPCRRLRYGQNA
jgi:hypothetical protein